MMLRPPDFWYQDHVSWAARLLTPLAWLYEGADHLKQSLTRTTRISVPVICVGNMTLGGAGKTPVVMDIVRRLHTTYHKNPHILTRGYGRTRSDKAPLCVHAHHTPKDVGDEPFLLGTLGPTWVGADRVASAHCAVQSGADVVVMDDGLQNQSLYKDLTIVVVDGAQKCGNGKIFPAGPLRTSMRQGLSKADLVLLIHGSDAYAHELSLYGKPVVRGMFEPTLPIPPQPVMAFAGIGYPHKFKQYLCDLGFDVVAFQEYPDHHNYTLRDCEVLLERSLALGVPLITTQKDSVKWCMPEYSPHVVTIQLDYQSAHDVSLVEDHVRMCIA